ncbi:MAG: Hsp20/alpha crystallin family protein [Cyclobacteriaceae bacterium]
MKVANNGSKTQVPTFDNWLDRLFDVPSNFELGSPVSSTKNTLPAVNINEDKQSYQLEIAAPGFKKEDFKINYEKDSLVISSEIKEESKSEGKTTRREFNYSSFSRSFYVPEDSVDVEKISAQYQDGILTIAIPKKAIENKVKQINIG